MNALYQWRIRRILSWRDFSKAQRATVEARRAESRGKNFGEEQLCPCPPARGSGERCRLPSGVRGWAAAVQRFSYILSALDGVFCCILGAFCTKTFYAVQRGKGCVMFLEAMWNSKSHTKLHQVQLANAHTRHYSYTSARKRLVVANRAGGSDPM